MKVTRCRRGDSRRGVRGERSWRSVKRQTSQRARSSVVIALLPPASCSHAAGERFRISVILGVPGRYVEAWTPARPLLSATVIERAVWRWCSMIANVAAGPETPRQDLGQSGGTEPWRVDACRGECHTGKSASNRSRSPSGWGRAVRGHETCSAPAACGRGLAFQDRAVRRLARRRCDRPTACGSFASPPRRPTSDHLAPATAVLASARHRC